MLRVRMPLVVSRVLTLVPALVIVIVGSDPTRSLVLSQVVLSLLIPFALIPLVVLSSKRSVMGQFANPRPLTAAAWVVVALIIALNLALVALTLTGAA
jgi:manganese transport protein